MAGGGYLQEMISMDDIDFNQIEDIYGVRVYDAKQMHRIETLVDELHDLLTQNVYEFRVAQHGGN